MEAGFILLLIVAIVVGVAVGMFIGRALVKRRYERETEHTQGILNVDCGDPEFEPSLYLNLNVPIADVVSRKHVMFSVNVME